jgi:hypothetical protein
MATRQQLGKQALCETVEAVRKQKDAHGNALKVAAYYREPRCATGVPKFAGADYGGLKEFFERNDVFVARTDFIDKGTP